jgi:hypothetical protein
MAGAMQVDREMAKNGFIFVTVRTDNFNMQDEGYLLELEVVEIEKKGSNGEVLKNKAGGVQYMQKAYMKRFGQLTYAEASEEVTTTYGMTVIQVRLDELHQGDIDEWVIRVPKMNTGILFKNKGSGVLMTVPVGMCGGRYLYDRALSTVLSENAGFKRGRDPTIKRLSRFFYTAFASERRAFEQIARPPMEFTEEYLDSLRVSVGQPKKKATVQDLDRSIHSKRDLRAMCNVEAWDEAKNQEALNEKAKEEAEKREREKEWKVIGEKKKKERAITKKQMSGEQLDKDIKEAVGMMEEEEEKKKEKEKGKEKENKEVSFEEMNGMKEEINDSDVIEGEEMPSREDLMAMWKKSRQSDKGKKQEEEKEEKEKRMREEREEEERDEKLIQGMANNDSDS